MAKPEVEFTIDAFAKAEHYCYVAFKEYQKAQDLLDMLHESSKDYLAVIMCEIEAQRADVKVSEAKLERLARSSDKWTQHRKEYADAVQSCGEAKFRYFSTVRFYETIQSGLAYKRAEMSRL